MKRLSIFTLGLLVLVSNFGFAASTEDKEDEKHVRELLQDLKIGLYSEKQAALEQLGELKDPVAFDDWNISDAIVALTDNANPRMARLAVKTLGDIAQWNRGASNDDIKKKLVSILNRNERSRTPVHDIVRAEICIQLSRMMSDELGFTNKGIIAALEAATKPGMRNPRILVRVEAVKALGRFAHTSSRDALRSALFSNIPSLRNAGIEAVLSALKGKYAEDYRNDAPLVSKMMKLASSSNVEVVYRANILESLARIIRKGGRLADFSRKLVALLKETEDQATVIAALKAVAISGEKTAAALLPEISKRFEKLRKANEDEEDNDQRGGGQEKNTDATLDIAICETIGELFNYWGDAAQKRNIPTREYNSLVEFLGKIVIKDTSELQTKAAYALGHAFSPTLDRTRVAAYLIAALSVDEVSEETKKAAVDSLRVLTSQAFGNNAKAWDAWYKKSKRSLGAR